MVISLRVAPSEGEAGDAPKEGEAEERMNEQQKGEQIQAPNVQYIYCVCMAILYICAYVADLHRKAVESATMRKELLGVPLNTTQQ